MAISLPDARQLSDEVLQSLRLRALRGCELGYSEIEVAELLGLSRETVSRWWTAYVDHGLEALPGDRTGRPVGSGRTLNDGQAARLRTILNEKSPEEVGIASPLWTRRAVAELIRKEYGIDMPVRTVGEYLERWGYTAKVPRRHAKDQDPEEVRHWLEVTYPAIKARAAREDAEIHWCDETGAAADQQPRRGYAREGRPARIEVPDPHIRMNLISTISNEGSVHFMTYKETMTAALFITFLERMLSETTRKIFLIVDRLRAHEAKKVEAWAAEHRDRIELFFLPRYAPERNADEYLNNDMKGSINATGLPGSQEGLAEDPGVHDQVAAPAGACSSVLPTPLRQVCCWYLICDHLTCRRNSKCPSVAVGVELELLVLLLCPLDQLSSGDRITENAYQPDEPCSVTVEVGEQRSKTIRPRTGIRVFVRRIRRQQTRQDCRPAHRQWTTCPPHMKEVERRQR